MSRPKPPRLVLDVHPDWTVGLAIATCLEGLPGYDGATLADLIGQLTAPMPPGELVVPDAADPIEPVRAILAGVAPGYALEPDEKGSLRLRPPADAPAQTNPQPAPDAEVTENGPA